MAMKETTKRLIGVFQSVLEEMKPEFTSHSFIQRLAQKHQGLYICALYPYRESVAPFRALHVEIAHQLKHFNLQEMGEVDSKDIFGDSSFCMKWRKL